MGVTRRDYKIRTIRFYTIDCKNKCLEHVFASVWPSRVAQSVGHLTRKSGSWVRYPVLQHTFVSPSAFSRRAVVSYWRKYVHEVLVNRLGGLRADFTSKLVHGLAFGPPKFYIAPYDKINHGLVNLTYNCDVKLGLSLPRKSVVRLTDRPDMTLDVYRGRKTTMQQQQQIASVCTCSVLEACPVYKISASSNMQNRVLFCSVLIKYAGAC